MVLRIRWCRPPVFFWVFLPVFEFWFCCQVQDASRRFFWSTFLLVGKQLFWPFSTSVFCVSFQHGIFIFSCVLQLLWYFSWCIQSSLLLFRWSQLLRQFLLGKTRPCLDLCVSFVFICFFVGRKLVFFVCVLVDLFSLVVRCIFFWFVFSFCLFDKAKHLSLRSLDHFSCFCDSGHVPPAYVKVGVMTILNRRSMWHSR